MLIEKHKLLILEVNFISMSSLFHYYYLLTHI